MSPRAAKRAPVNFIVASTAKSLSGTCDISSTIMKCRLHPYLLVEVVKHRAAINVLALHMRLRDGVHRPGRGFKVCPQELDEVRLARTTAPRNVAAKIVDDALRRFLLEGVVLATTEAWLFGHNVPMALEEKARVLQPRPQRAFSEARGQLTHLCRLVAPPR